MSGSDQRDGVVTPTEDTPSSVLGEHPLAEPGADVEFQRMGAAIASRLFGAGGSARIGRFNVLEQVGRGGMGTVYAAYDPQLDRKVAVKILRRDREGHNQRLLREARALAKLSHPNVVTVYEVSEVGDTGEVFIAMEFLGGGTLRTWMRERDASAGWQTVIEILVDVGRGLAAAHHAGLVHRDFKPENVLLGDDGRPRVADFGLARATSVAADAAPSEGPDGEGCVTRDGSRFAGTPAYMAPEQRGGAEVDARSDQYSYCVVLHEALFGARPGDNTDPGATDVPPGVVEAVRRGLSRDPDDRFPDLEALLRAIAPQPRRGRRRAFAAVGLAAAALAAGAFGARAWGEAPDDPCGSERGLAAARPARNAPAGADEDTWTHFEGAAAEYRKRVTNELDRACVGDPEPATLDCLRRGLRQLEAIAAAVDAERASLTKGLEAAKQLADPSACADPARLAAKPPPPTDPELRAAVAAARDRLSQANAQALLGLEPQARPELEGVLATARELSHRALEADALSALGRIDMRAQRAESADRLFRDAELAADAAGHDWARVDALVNRAAIQGMLLGQPQEAAAIVVRARAGIDRLGGPALLAEDLAITEGTLHYAAGQHADAIAALEGAVTMMEGRVGLDAFRLVRPLNTLAAARAKTGAVAAAQRDFERALALVDAHYGRHHPLYGRVLTNVGAAARDVGDLEAAKRFLEESFELTAEVLGADHPSVAVAGHNLADVLIELGHGERALRIATDAVRVAERAHGVDSVDLRWTLATRALAQSGVGHADDALATVERAMSLVTEEWGDDALQLVVLLEVRAEIYRALSRAADRRADLERAAAVSQKHQAAISERLEAALEESG